MPRIIPKKSLVVSNVDRSFGVTRCTLARPQYARHDPVSTQSHERRRYPRYDVGKLPGVLDGFRLFETLKISAGGALIRLPAELALEQRVSVALEIDGDGTFRSAADIVFVGPDVAAGSAGLFRVGLAFVDTPAEDRARLQRFIQRSIAADRIE
jgi:hypothetical protein